MDLGFRDVLSPAPDDRPFLFGHDRTRLVLAAQDGAHRAGGDVPAALRAARGDHEARHGRVVLAAGLRRSRRRVTWGHHRSPFRLP